ncbi:oxidase UstYa family protein [Microdochium nivale]|nr:oxidase UstYa family protein [Microdochium nivale]
MWFKSASYESLPQSETSTAKTQTSKSYLSSLSPRRKIASWSKTTMALAATNALTLLALLASIRSRSILSDAACVQKPSTPSPALEAVQYLPPSHYKAEFRQTNPWRPRPGEHSDDVDLAWYQIELGAGGIRLTEEEVLALNYTEAMINDPERPLHRVPDEHGGGYLAMLEVFHLLHCLNTLRMGLFYNYDKYYKKMDEGVHDENIYTHFDHCIDMLRLQLTCTADVTPALFYDALDNPCAATASRTGPRSTRAATSTPSWTGTRTAPGRSGGETPGRTRRGTRASRARTRRSRPKTGRRPEMERVITTAE